MLAIPLLTFDFILHLSSYHRSFTNENCFPFHKMEYEIESLSNNSTLSSRILFFFFSHPPSLECLQWSSETEVRNCVSRYPDRSPLENQALLRKYVKSNTSLMFKSTQRDWKQHWGSINYHDEAYYVHTTWEIIWLWEQENWFFRECILFRRVIYFNIVWFWMWLIIFIRFSQINFGNSEMTKYSIYPIHCLTYTSFGILMKSIQSICSYR